MTIFGKKIKKPTSEEEMMDLKESSNQTITETVNYTRAKPGAYSIDQAIQLVSSLKGHRVSAQVIASIVKQTLESVDIHFSDIIADAKLKESAIQAEKSKRDDLIKSLAQQVENLQKEKVEFQKELNKTIFVREFLEQAVATEVSGDSEEKYMNPAAGTEVDDADEQMPAPNVAQEPVANNMPSNAM